MLLLLPMCLQGGAKVAKACPACWAGYGSGDERLNKPLADLRILYETKGRDALPRIREVLRTSSDPRILRRAAGYIVALNDREAIPLLEDMLLELTKRVAFGAFGLDTYAFQGRLAVAHALAEFGPTLLGESIWQRYDRMDFNRKGEVPYLLNALQTPRLTDYLLEILDRGEDHQLMLGALEMLADGGNATALPALNTRMARWRQMDTQPGPAAGSPVLHFAVLRIRAEQAIAAIEARAGGSVIPVP